MKEIKLEIIKEDGKCIKADNLDIKCFLNTTQYHSN